MIGAKDLTKQDQVNTYLDTKALQLQARTRAIRMKVAIQQSSLSGRQGLRHVPAGGAFDVTANC